MLSVNAHHSLLMRNPVSFRVYSPACWYILELNKALWGGVKFIDGGVDVVEQCARVSNFLGVRYRQKEPVIDLKHLPINCSKCLKWEMFGHFHRRVHQTGVSFLRYVIISEGLEIDKHKVAAGSFWAEPITLRGSNIYWATLKTGFSLTKVLRRSREPQTREIKLSNKQMTTPHFSTKFLSTRDSKDYFLQINSGLFV